MMTKTLILAAIFGSAFSQMVFPNNTMFVAAPLANACSANSNCPANQCCMYTWLFNNTVPPTPTTNGSWGLIPTPQWYCLSNATMQSQFIYDNSTNNYYTVQSNQCMGSMCNYTTQCQGAGTSNSNNYCCQPATCTLTGGNGTVVVQDVCAQPNMMNTQIATPTAAAIWNCTYYYGGLNTQGQSINTCQYQACSGMNLNNSFCAAGQSCMTTWTYTAANNTLTGEQWPYYCGANALCGTSVYLTNTVANTANLTTYGCTTQTNANQCNSITGTPSVTTTCPENTNTTMLYCCANITATPTTGNAAPEYTYGCVANSMASMSSMTAGGYTITMQCLNAKMLAVTSVVIAVFASFSI